MNSLRVISLAAVLSLFALFAVCSTGSSLPAGTLFEKGTEYLEKNQYEKALEHFSLAAEKQPADSSYHWAAATTAIRLQRHNEALIHAQAAWENGMKTNAVLQSLLSLSTHTASEQKLDYALSLYADLPADQHTALAEGDIHYQLGNADKALAIWLNADSTSREQQAQLCVRIARARNVTGNTAEALETLAACRDALTLDQDGYILYGAILAGEYRFEEAHEAFEHARKYGHYTLRAEYEHALVSLVEGNLDKAYQKFRSLADPAPDPKDELLAHKARIAASFVSALQGNAAAVDEIASLAKGNQPWVAPEQEFHASIGVCMSDTVSRLEAVTDIRGRLPRNPVIELVYARELAKAGRHADAAAAYKDIPGVLLRAPMAVTELARSLDKAGKSEEALGLLAALVNRNMASRRSLELLRDITAREGLDSNAEAIQKLLAKRYRDDAATLWETGRMAIRKGRYDEAIRIFDTLTNRHPDEPRFETSRLQALLLKEEYARVVKEASRNPAHEKAVAPLVAKAHARMGNEKQALETLERALAKHRTPKLLLEYANLCIEQKKLEQGVAALHEALTDYKGKLDKENDAAVLLTSIAWGYIAGGGSDMSVPVKAAKQAIALEPKNLYVIDTYISALMRAEKYDECISFIENSSRARQEPQALFMLGAAYEKKKERGRALQAFRKCLAIPDAQAKLPLTIGRKELEKHVKALSGN